MNQEDIPTGASGESAAAFRPAALPTSPRGQIPARIGPYQIRSILGEGGFGLVYLADQTEPVRRRVAVKVIKAGMDSARVLARFEAERQALAMMDHPNIAKILDAGTTDEALGSRPYFVMEHIAGEPITEYCDRERLTIADRLALLIPVCEAVQHAHTRGIIHRDLKPGNILVAIDDTREPVPKIIDFGVAKALHQRLSAETMFTERGQIIGTPEYMSPEQAEMGPLDIDTRSDVYSLGVLMYELLAGVRPFDLRNAALVEIARIIREVEPPRPSTRVSEVGEHSDRIALARRVEASSLAGSLQRELEWIPLKALRKDRKERYQSAADLAQDIRNFLGGQPLMAGPETASYRVRKFVSRHRVGVAAGIVVVGALVLGAIGTTAGMLWALRERARATDAARAEALASAAANRSAEEARGTATLAQAESLRAQRAAEQALVEKRRAQSINSFLQETLASADPNHGGRQDMLVTDAMMRAIDRLDGGQFLNDPATEGSIRLTIASVLSDNGRPDAAFEQAERSLALLRAAHAEDDEELARAISRAGQIHYMRGDIASAAPLLEEALSMRRRLHAEDHQDLVNSLNDLALLRINQGHPDQAEPMLRQALDMVRRLEPGDSREVLAAMRSLAYLLGILGQPREASEMLSQAKLAAERVYPGDHPERAGVLSDLASMHLGLGELETARTLLTEALAMRRRMFAGDHDDIASAWLGLGQVEIALRHPDAAQEHLQAALDMFARLHPGDHPGTANALQNQARVRLEQGRLEEAETLLTRSVEMFARLSPDNHANIASGLNNIGFLRERLHRPDEAAAAYTQAIALYHQSPHGGGVDLGTCLTNLAGLHLEASRADLAEPLYREAIEVFERIYGSDHINIAQATMVLGECLSRLGRVDEATGSISAAEAMAARLLPESDPRRQGLSATAARLRAAIADGLDPG